MTSPVPFTANDSAAQAAALSGIVSRINSGAQAASATQILPTFHVVRRLPASKLAHAAAHQAYRQYTECSIGGCGFWGDTSQELFWYNGSQAWGNSNYGNTSTGSYEICRPGSTFGYSITPGWCWFRPNGFPWANPASGTQHLSADDDYTLYAVASGFWESFAHYIHWYDYPNGTVGLAVG